MDGAKQTEKLVSGPAVVAIFLFYKQNCSLVKNLNKTANKGRRVVSCLSGPVQTTIPLSLVLLSSKCFATIYIH